MTNIRSFEEARKILHKLTIEPPIELVSLENSIGRVLAQDLVADRDYPPFNRAAMDGFAVHTDFFKSGNSFDIKSEVFAGTNISIQLEPNECVRIMTGAPVPDSCNAIVKIEDCKLEGNSVTFLVKNCTSWTHIARKGEDVKSGEIALQKGVTIGSGEIAVASSLGYAELQVYKLPEVSIVTTGNEIIPVDGKPLSHQIRNSNAWTLTALLKGIGLTPKSRIHIADDRDRLLLGIQAALDNVDALLISGGVSAGKSDFVPEVLSQIGVQKLFHKVLIKPGKPIWVGRHTSGKMVFALPGNPVSVQVCFQLFVLPWLMKFQGVESEKIEYRYFSGSRVKKNELDEFIMVQEEIKRPGFVKLKPFNGSGDITATAGISGFIHHPASVSELLDGTIVEFRKL